MSTGSPLSRFATFFRKPLPWLPRWLPAGVVAVLGVVVSIWWIYPDLSQLVARQGSPFYLEMEVLPEKSSWIQVYWRATGEYREGHSYRERLRATGRWQKIALPVKGYRIQELRFDPVMTDGFFQVRQLRLRTLEGRTIATFAAGDLLPLNQIEAIHEDANGIITILIEEEANDPYLAFAMEYPLHAPLGVAGIGARLVLYVILAALGSLLIFLTLVLFDPRRASTWAGLLITLWMVGLTTYWSHGIRLFIIPLPASVWQVFLLGLFSYPVVTLCRRVGARLKEKALSPPSGPENQPNSPVASRVAPVFVAVGLSFGSLFTFLSPMYQSPDELIWFYRIYDISEGNLLPRVIEEVKADGERERMAGAYLPIRSIENHWRATDGAALPFNMDRATNWETVRESWHLPFHEDRRQFRSLADTLHSLPPYLAQATGVALARSLGMPLTGQFYAGRLANLFLIIGLGYLVLRLTPCLHWTFAVVLLNPLALFLTASHSHDPLVTVLLLLILAYILRLREQERPIEKAQVANLVCLFVLVAISKFNYVILAPLTLLLPWAKFSRPATYFGSQAAIWGITAFITLLLLYIVSLLPSGDWGRPDIDRSERLGEVLADPLGNLGKLWGTIFFYGPEYLRQIGGVLGWLDTDVGAVVRWGWATLLAMAWAADSGYRWRNPLQAWERTGVLALAVLTFFSILAVFLLTWTVEGNLYVEGVQGRYFFALIPLLILALLWPQNWPAETRRWWFRATTVLLLLVLLGTSQAMYVRYWVPVWN